MRNDEYLNRLFQLREQTAEEAAEMASLERECSQMETTIAELNNEQGNLRRASSSECSHFLAEIREESSELKALSNNLRDGLSAISLKIDELRCPLRPTSDMG